MTVDRTHQDGWAAKQQVYNRARAAEDLLHGGGPGGTSGGMSEDWKAGVDAQLKTLHEDFRKLIGWLIAAVAAPLLAVIGLYVFSGLKFDATTVRIDALSNQVTAARVEVEKQRGDQRAANAEITGRLDRIADRLPRDARP